MKKIGFIGTGHIATAMIKALLRSDLYTNEDIIVYDSNQDKLKDFKQTFNVVVAKDNRHLATNCDVIMLSVRPNVLKAVIEEIKDLVHTQIVISPAAGIESNKILKWFDKDIKLSRIMPNVGAALSESMTAYFSLNLSKEDSHVLEDFLNALGQSILIPEDDFHTFIPLSGSSPAFFAYFVDVMVDYGVKHGFDKKTATKMVAQSMFATAHMLLEDGALLDTFVESVASKGGTTEAGVKTMRKEGFEAVIKAALKATEERSKSIK